MYKFKNLFFIFVWTCGWVCYDKKSIFLLYYKFDNFQTVQIFAKICHCIVIPNEIYDTNHFLGFFHISKFQKQQ